LVFEPSLVVPPSIEGVIQELSSSRGKSKVVAGNTSLYRLVRNEGVNGIIKLVDIANLGLGYIKEVKDTASERNRRLQIGATSTFSEIATSSLIRGRSEFSALVDSANASPPQIRNMATIGGSVCSRISFYDVPVALMALCANLRLISTQGEKIATIEDYFKDSALWDQHLLVEVQIPFSVDSKMRASSFSKLCRRASGFAIVNAAVDIALDPSARMLQEVRLAVGAISKSPERLLDLEEIMTEREVSLDLIEQACKKAHVGEVVDSVHASAEYKKKVLPSILRDALLLAIERARENRLRRKYQ
jgi:CO/xanthine dehydrogenase FAD-binding subunit